MIVFLFKLRFLILFCIARIRYSFRDIIISFIKDYIQIFFKKTNVQIFQAIENTKATKLCIFSLHQNIHLRESTYIYLKHLKENNYSICIIITSRLDQSMLDRLKSICDEIIIRENIGYDFGSYKYGILRHLKKLNQFDNILIANDSVIGPFYNLEPIFSEMNNKKCDFWGISHTISSPNENCCHVNSFFVVFKKNVITSEVFKNFWINYKSTSSRIKTINTGEKMLSKILIKYGNFKMDSLFSQEFFYNESQKDSINFFENNIKYSQTNLFSDNKNIISYKDCTYYNSILYLLKHHNNPFIKKDLLGRDINPYYWHAGMLFSILKEIKIETTLTADIVIQELIQNLC